MTIAPDGFSINYTPPGANNVTSISCQLTTSHNGVVIVAVQNLGFFQNALVAPPAAIPGGKGDITFPTNNPDTSPITDSSGQGLLWQVLGEQADPYGHGYVQWYYAVTSAPFTNVTLLALFETPTETAGIMAFGLDDIELTDLLDSSPPNGVGFDVTPQTMYLTTKEAPDVALLLYGINGAIDNITSITPGWTEIGSMVSSGGTNYNVHLVAYYQYFTGPVNTLPITINHTGGGADAWTLQTAAFHFQQEPVTTSRVTAVGF